MTKEKIEELEEEIQKLKEQHENFVLETIRKIEGDEELPDRLREDKEFMLEVLKQRIHHKRYSRRFFISDEFIIYVSNSFKDDTEFALKAVKIYDEVFFHLSGRLKNDKEFVLKALKCTSDTGCILRELSEKLKDDKDVVIEAIRGEGYAFLSYASDRLQADKDVVLEAVKRDGKKREFGSIGFSLNFASQEIQYDKDFVIEAIVQFLEALKEYDFDLEYTSRNILHYNEFLLEALKKI